MDRRGRRSLQGEIKLPYEKSLFRSGFLLCINVLQLLEGVLHEGDIEVAVALAELVDELLFELLVLQNDAVVQLEEGAVVLGLDAVEVSVAAVLLDDGIKHTRVIEGLGNEDAQALARAAEAVDPDDREEHDEQQDDADGDGTEADEANAAGNARRDGEVVVNDIAGILHRVAEADQRETAADGDGAGDVGADTDNDDGHDGTEEHHGKEHGGTEARAAMGEYVHQHDGDGKTQRTAHDGQRTAEGDDRDINGLQNVIHNQFLQINE